jgi:hypothetical protein
MWNFLVIVTLESDSFVSEECREIQVVKENCSFYTWNPAGIYIDGYDSKKDSLILNFVLECSGGRILVKKETIVLSKLNYNPQTNANHIFKENKIQINYSAFKYVDDNQTLGQIRIDVISLLDVNLNHIIKESNNGHKITCLLNDIYLSRAQLCSTNQNELTRTYTWYSNENNSFGSLFPRGKDDIDIIKEDNYDLHLIRFADPSGITNTKRNVEFVSFLPDIDSYSNPTSRLPIKLHENERVHIRIFNFRFTPPKCVETVFQWKEFIPSPALSEPKGHPVTIKSMFRRKSNNPIVIHKIGMVQRMLLNDLNVSIMFIKNENDGIVLLNSIRVEAKDYEETLKMTEIQKMITM